MFSILELLENSDGESQASQITAHFMIFQIDHESADWGGSITPWFNILFISSCGISWIFTAKSYTAYAIRSLMRKRRTSHCVWRQKCEQLGHFRMIGCTTATHQRGRKGLVESLQRLYLPFSPLNLMVTDNKSRIEIKCSKNKDSTTKEWEGERQS